MEPRYEFWNPLLLCYSQLIILEDSYNSSVPKIEAWHDTHKPLASKCAFSLCQWNYELHGKFPNFFCGILLGTFGIVKNTFLETQEFFFILRDMLMLIWTLQNVH